MTQAPRRSLWLIVAIALALIATLVAGLCIVHYAQANLESSVELAHLRALDARIAAAASTQSFIYTRPPLTDCQGPIEIHEDTWRRITEAGSRVRFTTNGWVSADERAPGAVAALEEELLQVSRLACAEYREDAPDAQVVRAATTLMLMHAAYGPATHCAQLVVRAVRIAQDGAARSDAMDDRMQWLAMTSGALAAAPRCAERLDDEGARAFADSLANLAAAYPPIARVFVGEYASYARERVRFATREVTTHAPWGSPFTQRLLPELEAVTDLFEAGGPDWTRYPETLTGSLCGSAHETGACLIDRDAHALRDLRYVALIAEVLAQAEPRRLPESLDVLDGPLGVDPTDASRIRYAPTESRWRAVLSSGDPRDPHRVVVSEPRSP